MNLVFFGTNYDGAYFLPKLVRNYDIRMVVTDLLINDSWMKFVKRFLLRRKLTEDIARWKSDILLIDQGHITRKKFISVLKENNIKLGVVATFSKIIPRSVIESIPLGIINVHPSLLPKYRGANPIFWAIRNGERKFGITVHYLDEKIDTGDIILQKEILIENHYTIIECKKIFFQKGLDLLREGIDMISKSKVRAVVQKNDLASYYPPASDEYRTINVEEQSFEEIGNIIRASIDKGGAVFWDNGKKFLIKSMHETPCARGQFIKVHIEDGDYFLQH